MEKIAHQQMIELVSYFYILYKHSIFQFELEWEKPVRTENKKADKVPQKI